jgi:acyl dehydratase
MPKPVLLPTPQSLLELVGREVAVTEWFPVSQQRIQQFAEATEDRQWIHTDCQRAQRESPYRASIAHGFLTLSLLPRLLSEALQIQHRPRLAINYGLNRVRFPAPVNAGSKIRARFTVHSVVDAPGALETIYSVTVEAEGAPKPCCVAEWIVRYYL